MTHKEYESKLRVLLDEVEFLKQSYIDANKPCSLGSKIQFESSYYRGKTMTGVCTGFGIGYGSHYYKNNDSDVYAIFKKVKKDGTASDVDLCIWAEDRPFVRFVI